MFYKNAQGNVLKLLVMRESDINTFVHCNSKGVTIVDKRNWLSGKQTSEQRYLIKGFDNLTEVDLR